MNLIVKITSIVIILALFTLPGLGGGKEGAGKDGNRVGMKLVVVDPGHGGVDSGAVGPDGLLEKNVTLKVALIVKALLEKNLGVNVAITRNGDYYVSLEERTAMANNLGADLFVSIHANAAPRGGWGFETYFLSAQASDDEARLTALMENYPQEYEGMLGDISPKTLNDLEGILWDLTQTEHLRESELLATFIQDSLATTLKNPNRGVKQAPFFVLAGATMPAVLVEIGFISNRSEGKHLADSKMQEKIAKAICTGVTDFTKLYLKRNGKMEAKVIQKGSP